MSYIFLIIAILLQQILFIPFHNWIICKDAVLCTTTDYRAWDRDREGQREDLAERFFFYGTSRKNFDHEADSEQSINVLKQRNISTHKHRYQ